MSTILEEIETKIAGLKTSTTRTNVGVVRETGDGVARIEGIFQGGIWQDFPRDLRKGGHFRPSPSGGHQAKTGCPESTTEISGHRQADRAIQGGGNRAQPVVGA